MLAARAKFKLMNEKKAKGPEGITPKILKTGADQLGEVYTSILNWSIEECELPMLIKDSTIIPVPETIFCMFR